MKGYARFLVKSLNLKIILKYRKRICGLYYHNFHLSYKHKKYIDSYIKDLDCIQQLRKYYENKFKFNIGFDIEDQERF